MNRGLAVGNDPWMPARYASEEPVNPQRSYSATNFLDLATVLRAIHHWRMLIAATVAVGLAGAIVVTLLTPPIYRARATLEANPPAFEVTDSKDGDQQQASQANSPDFVATQVGLLQSRAVAERAAQQLNLANNPQVVPANVSASNRLREATSVIARSLKVTPPESGDLIAYTVDARTPELAASIANAIADGFITSAIQRRYESSAYARSFLERQINKTRADLEQSERGLVQYAQAQGIVSTSSANSSTGQGGSGDTDSLQGASLVQLNQALAQAISQRIAAEGAYRQSLNTGPTSEVTQSTLALQQQLGQLQAEYQQKRTFMKPDHPEMVSLRSQIDELQRQMTKEQAQVSSGHTNTLLAQYRAALSTENNLKSRVAQLKGDVLNLRGRSIQYTILQRDVDTNRALYDALLQRYKQIGVAGGIGLAPVSIVDRADPPGGRFKPNLLLNILGGLALGFLSGVAGALGIEFVNDTIKTREDVRHKLAVPCFGAVPLTRTKGAFIDDLKDPTSSVSEAYSAIVAALRFSTESGMPKVLLLTSTRPSEGKSSSALALAQNFARRGRSVLLIDGDLRKPAFKAANDKNGLSKLLTTEDTLEDHVVETQHANLWLLPSGPIPPNPADLLSTGRARKIIAEASDRFDFVVIDGPPTIGLADAPLLGAAAGNVVFIVESGKTRTRAAVESINRIESTGAHILGAILTKSAETAGGYGYGYGYGYGKAVTYKQGSDKERNTIALIPGGDKGDREVAAEEADA